MEDIVQQRYNGLICLQNCVRPVVDSLINIEFDFPKLENFSCYFILNDQTNRSRIYERCYVMYILFLSLLQLKSRFSFD